MSIVGFDFGNESCYISVMLSDGRFEIITNDFSQRNTPSCVAFGPKHRLLGVAAHNQHVANIKNTLTNFKLLVGAKYQDVTSVIDDMPNNCGELAGGSVGIEVQFKNETEYFKPEQLTAMLFTKLKETAAAALNTEVCDVVISVPCFFTGAQRAALFDSAKIAGLNVLELMNDTTASALAYGYKHKLLADDIQPRNVMFVDCGQSAVKAAVCAFKAGTLEVLSTSCDPTAGGAEFDRLLMEHFKKEFFDKYQIDAQKDPSACLRLADECAKLKNKMSVNTTTLPINIDCFMDNHDLTGELHRAKFEKMAEKLLDKIRNALIVCIEESGLKGGNTDIYAVEIVGGGSRVPAIKNMIKEVFGQAPKATLNQNEAVARGCALRCAGLKEKVAAFNITEQPIPIGKWHQPISTSEHLHASEAAKQSSEYANVPTDAMDTDDCIAEKAGVKTWMETGMPPMELRMHTGKETKMIAEDQKEQERQDSKNALEEYMYDCRKQLDEDKQLSKNKAEFMDYLNRIQSMLYLDGDDCTEQKCQEILKYIQSKAEQIKSQKPTQHQKAVGGTGGAIERPTQMRQSSKSVPKNHPAQTATKTDRVHADDHADYQPASQTTRHMSKSSSMKQESSGKQPSEESKAAGSCPRNLSDHGASAPPAHKGSEKLQHSGENQLSEEHQPTLRERIGKGAKKWFGSGSAP